MNVILRALVRRIKQRAYLDTDEEIARWIEEYIQSEQLHKPVVGGPASASVSEGEQLGNEAGEKGVNGGTINTEGSNRKRWSENDDTFVEM